MTRTIEVRFRAPMANETVVVVVWTVSWPRRERCPGTLRVTIPRSSSPPFPPPPSSVSSAPPYLLSYTTCPPFLRLFSLSLFPSVPLGQAPAFPRSFYRGLPRAGRPFRAPRRLTNMAAVRSLLSLPTFRRAGEETRGKKARREEFAFCALESELFAVFARCSILSEKFRSFEEDVQTLRLASIDSNRFKDRSIFDFFLFKRLCIVVKRFTIKLRRNRKKYFDIITFRYIFVR